MKALITGASSGFGYDMAKNLSERGYDIIAVARREDKLLELKKSLKTQVEVVVCDLTDEKSVRELALKAENVDIFINNAGFGVFGNFDETDLDRELKMIDTNVKAVHILTKLVVKAFKERGYGYILNVASLASFFPGPLFSGYYATKSYVLRLTQSIYEELRREKSKVQICALCPGPAHTGFANEAKVNFGTDKDKGAGFVVLSSKKVADYAIKKMFKGKPVIIPGLLMKTVVFARHFLSDRALARIIYLVQSKKCVIKDEKR